MRSSEILMCQPYPTAQAPQPKCMEGSPTDRAITYTSPPRIKELLPPYPSPASVKLVPMELKLA